MGSRGATSGRSTRRRSLFARICLLLLPALVALPGYDTAAHVEAVAALRNATQVVQLTWMRVDTPHPDTLYVGGYLRHGFPCPEIGGFPCPTWSARSVDGGATWRSMDGALQGRGAGSRLPPFKPCIYPRSFIYPADTGYVYATITVHCSPAGSFSSVLRSRDRGLRWQALFSAHGGVDPSYDNLAISPVAASRVYAVTVDDGPSGGSYNARLRVTDDAGAHWRIASGDMTITQPGGLQRPRGGGAGRSAPPRHRVLRAQSAPRRRRYPANAVVPQRGRRPDLEPGAAAARGRRAARVRAGHGYAPARPSGGAGTCQADPKQALVRVQRLGAYLAGGNLPGRVPRWLPVVDSG